MKLLLIYLIIICFIWAAEISAKSPKNEELLLKVMPDAKCPSPSCKMSKVSKDTLKEDEEYYSVEFEDGKKEPKATAQYSKPKKTKFESLAKSCDQDGLRPNIQIYPIQQAGSCCYGGGIKPKSFVQPSGFQKPIHHQVRPSMPDAQKMPEPTPGIPAQPRPQVQPPLPLSQQQKIPEAVQSQIPSPTAQSQASSHLAQPQPQPSASIAQPQPSTSAAQPQPSTSAAQPQPSTSAAQPQPQKKPREPQQKPTPTTKPGKPHKPAAVTNNTAISNTTSALNTTSTTNTTTVSNATSTEKPSSSNTNATSTTNATSPTGKPSTSTTNTTSPTGKPTTPTNATTPSSGSQEGGSVTVSEEEFDAAVTVCGYPKPPSDKYKSFIAGIPKSDISSKRELAMFLSQILHESDGLQAKSEIQCQGNGCKGQYDAAADGTVYFGRGYTQLTWKANYEAASKDLYGDDRLVQKPETVATDEDISWATAFWYWKTRVHTAPGVTEGKFGASTKAINGALECSGGENPKAKKRFEYYTKILKAFGINEAPIESGCYN